MAFRDRHPLLDVISRPPPWRAMAVLPTPVERVPWLDGAAAEVWIKRDDRSSPIYGGGKVRKLEWVLGSAPHDGERPIVSIGGIGSHHLLALALFLAPLGRRVHAWAFDQVVTDHVRTNLAVMASLGTRFWSVRSRVRLPWAAAAYYTWARPDGPRARWLTPGASNALGALGFVAAGLELAAQVAQGELPAPTRVYITGGSAGSSAGLIVGLGLAGLATHVRVVSAVEPIFLSGVSFRSKLTTIVRFLARDCGLDPAHARGGVRGLLRRGGVTWSLDHSQVGRGYAVPTDAGLDAVRLAKGGGIPLETTYTGKCTAALRADLARPDTTPRGPVLLWNTHAGNDLREHIKPGWEQALPARLQRLLADA